MSPSSDAHIGEAFSQGDWRSRNFRDRAPFDKGRLTRYCASMQVDFYQLSRDPVDRVLPIIATRILSSGHRLLVVADTQDRLLAIAQGLWSAELDSFLANGLAGEGRDSVQPILLSQTCEAGNGARHIALVDGEWREDALRFDRAFYFFDAQTIDRARQSWRDLSKREDVTPRFWRQEGRKWIQGP